MIVCAVCSCQILIAGLYLCHNGCKGKTMVDFCLALMTNRQMNTTTKTNTPSENYAAHDVSCTDPYLSIMLSRGFTVMRLQNALDTSCDWVYRPHDSSKCVVKYDGFLITYLTLCWV